VSEGGTSNVLVRGAVYVVACLTSFAFMVPFFWAMISSLKTWQEIRRLPPTILPAVPQWQNYPEIFRLTDFGLWGVNTVFLVVVVMSGTVLTSSLAGYSFARFRYPGRDLLFMITLSTMMLPAEVTLIPSYLLYFKLGWLNTYLPLTVPAWCGGSAFFIFLLRQFFLTIPLDLDEAAKLDGANYLQIFWNIIMPLSGPVLATVAIISAIFQWNSFILPLIILNDEVKFPLSIGIRYFYTSPGTEEKPVDQLLMAGSVLMTIPIVLLFFAAQRYFVRGVVMSGIKG
jgi:ABC-type glycerol-3-phosphate transport system permease component